MVYSIERDNRTLRGGPVSWNTSKNTSLDYLFPREKRDVKVEDFIKLRHGSIIVLEYSMKFTKFSKYGPFLI